MPFDLAPPPKLWTPPKFEIIRSRELPKSLLEERGIRTKLGMLPSMAAMWGGQQEPSVVAVSGSNGSLTSNTDSNTYTFSDVSGLGTHTHVFLLITGRGSASVQTVSSLTVEGASAALVSGAALSTGNQRAEIWAIAQSTTAPDIVVNWSGTLGNMSLGVVAATGVQSLTSFATPTTSSADPAALSINTAAGGIVLACGLNAAAGMTWTGVTELYEHQLETSFCHTGGYDLTAAAESPRTVSGNWNTLNFAAAVCASFR